MFWGILFHDCLSLNFCSTSHALRLPNVRLSLVDPPQRPGLLNIARGGGVLGEGSPQGVGVNIF